MARSPSSAESEHDIVANSHASTSLSYADGLAKAYRLRGETGRSVVAVIGDGALTELGRVGARHRGEFARLHQPVLRRRPGQGVPAARRDRPVRRGGDRRWRAHRARPSRSTTSWRIRTPPPACPTPTAWPRRTGCAARPAGPSWR